MFRISFKILMVAAALLPIVSIPFSGCGSQVKEESMAIVDDIAARRAQFAPQELTAKLDHLSAGDRQAIDHLIRAADTMHEIFKIQAWAGNSSFAAKVAKLEGEKGKAAAEYYRIMVGPWDRLVESEAFIEDLPHPQGAGYYPEDMTAVEFEGWLEQHPEDAEAFTGLHTMIRRKDGELIAIPYSQYFQDLLSRAADEMRAAALVTDNESLKHFLELRADAFMTDDYYESDMAWMDLDGDLEIVIGPYETYEDLLFGYKAAFEAFVCVVDPEDSAALDFFKAELPWLERNLPIADEHKNLDRGSDSPIRVADEVYTGGDTRAGVQTLAFNLPNDERVREAKGSKKVLLKNIMRAKFEAILKPLATKTLPADKQDHLDFDAFYHFILHHELAHGLGPGIISIDGRQTEVRLELKDIYSALEEAKADVLGIYNLHALADKGVIDAAYMDNLPWTVVPGLFRSARFGVTEAHGLGVVCQFSYLLEKGAIEITPEGRFQPVVEKWRAGIDALAAELLAIQAVGDYETGKAFIAKYGEVPEAMAAILSDLDDIPVDVDPVYSIVQQ